MNDYKSDEERYFADWLDELKEVGYIKIWEYEPETFILADKVEFDCLKQLKTKEKIEKYNAMQAVEYTYDFKIQWNSKAEGILFWDREIPFYGQKSKIIFFNTDTLFSYIDVKGTFKGKNNSSAISAPIKMKWLYQKYGIYVQVIKPLGGLFKNTFYPKSFFKTDKGADKKKKINKKLVPIKDLKQFKTIREWNI